VQKRSHTKLASALLQQSPVSARRFKWAFLFGSFQPDCNPFSYLKGSRRAFWLRGHNYSNSCFYLERRISSLQKKKNWTTWDYYTLGKVTHYVADAFTYPHNPHFHDGLPAHHIYERNMRIFLIRHLSKNPLPMTTATEDAAAAIAALHRQYLSEPGNFLRDARFILMANSLLMSSCLPGLSG